ncbi:unnamed protein product [Closterium sp. NIES-54]
MPHHFQGFSADADDATHAPPLPTSPLHCTALHCTALHCTALHCTALHCTALHCTALHCTALHCTALHCTALHTHMLTTFPAESQSTLDHVGMGAVWPLSVHGAAPMLVHVVAAVPSRPTPPNTVDALVVAAPGQHDPPSSPSHTPPAPTSAHSPCSPPAQRAHGVAGSADGTIRRSPLSRAAAGALGRREQAVSRASAPAVVRCWQVREEVSSHVDSEQPRGERGDGTGEVVVANTAGEGGGRAGRGHMQGGRS